MGFLTAGFTARCKMEETWATAFFIWFYFDSDASRIQKTNRTLQVKLKSTHPVSMWGRRWQVSSRIMSLWNGHIGLMSQRIFTVIKKKDLSTEGRRKTIKKQCDASHLHFLISHMYQNTPGDAMRCVFVVVFPPSKLTEERRQIRWDFRIPEEI